jgi:hypothetical protein
MNFSLDTKVKLLQAFAYVGFIVSIVAMFDWKWLLVGLAYSWLIFLSSTE